MKLELQEVGGAVRDSIPSEDETIYDDFKIYHENIYSLDIYLSPADACPFGIGNWVIDIQFKGGMVYAIKLPKEMPDEAVLRFCKPLIDDLERIDKENLH